MISRLMFQLSGYVSMMVSACFIELFLSGNEPKSDSSERKRDV